MREYLDETNSVSVWSKVEKTVLQMLHVEMHSKCKGLNDANSDGRASSEELKFREVKF